MFSAISMRRSMICTAIAGALVSAAPAFAGLAMTPAGTGLGLSLTTFANDFPTAADDPAGIGASQAAVDSAGKVYVTDYANGTTYVFPNNTNGQDALSLTPFVQTTPWGPSNVAGVVQLNGHMYSTGAGDSQIFDLDNGGYKTGSSLWTWYLPTGIVANPNNTGTLTIQAPHTTDQVHPGVFFSTGAGTDINNVLHTGAIQFMDPIQAALQNQDHPGEGQFVTSGTAVIPNSLAISADGSVLASVWSDNTIRFYSTALVPASFSNTLATLTGAGDIIMGTGAFSHDMFLSNNGELDMFDVSMINGVPTASFGTETILATGGAFGGYLAADPGNGANSLFVTESGTVYKLTASAQSGGAFVTPVPPVSVPEPASLTLLGLGGAAMLGLRGKRKAK
jgi:hypothetical protein